MMKVTPSETATRLRTASAAILSIAQAIEIGADKPAVLVVLDRLQQASDRASSVDVDTDLRHEASVRLSEALVSLRRLLMQDRRFDIGQWRAYLLEFLPHLVSEAWTDISPDKYRLIAQQVVAIAEALESLDSALLAVDRTNRFLAASTIDASKVAAPPHVDVRGAHDEAE